MLSKFVKATPNLIVFASRSCRTQQIQRLYYKPIYNFASNVKENSNAQKLVSQQVEEKAYSQRLLEEKMDSFIEFMQQTERDPNPNYVYNNREIYSIKSQYKFFVARQRGDFLTILSMLGAGAISYLYIHPFSVIIPMWFMAGSFISLLGARNMSNSLCKSMELLNFVYVKLRMLTGEELVCKIDEIEILGLKEWSPAKGKDKTKKYLVLGYFKDIHSKVPKEIRFIIDPQITKIDNLDLFRAIFHKDVKDIEKYQLKESPLEPKNLNNPQTETKISKEDISKLEEELTNSKKNKKN